jgi:hypothetical protein
MKSNQKENRVVNIVIRKQGEAIKDTAIAKVVNTQYELLFGIKMVGEMGSAPFVAVSPLGSVGKQVIVSIGDVQKNSFKVFWNFIDNKHSGGKHEKSIPTVKKR